MKSCVFVDGEHFRHSINEIFEGVFDKDDYLPKKANWAKFFDYLVKSGSDDQAERLRTYWYVIADVDFWPPLPTEWAEANNPGKVEEWITRNSRYISESGFPKEEAVAAFRKRKNDIAARFDGFRRVQRGIESSHHAVEFRRSGAISYKLYEKNSRPACPNCGKILPQELRKKSKAMGKEKTVDVNLAVDMLQMRDAYDIAIIVSGDQDYLPVVQAIKNAGKTVVNVSFKDNSGKMLPGGAKRLNEAADRPLIIDYATFADFLGLAAKRDEVK